MWGFSAKWTLRPQAGRSRLDVCLKGTRWIARGREGRVSVIDLAKQLVEDWSANDKDWTRPGLQALAVHRFGVWRMEVKPRLLRAPLSLLYRALFRGVRNFYGVELPYTAKIGRRLRIEHQGVIVVHSQAVIGDDCRLHQGVTEIAMVVGIDRFALQLGRHGNATIFSLDARARCECNSL